MTATTVEFYFDPVSPYAWLAVEQIDRIIEAGGQIACRPILFAALLNEHATKGPAEVPAKRAYVFRDVMRQAKRQNLPFVGPPSHPFNPLAALRAIHAVEDEERQLFLVRHLLSAVWREGVDVDNPQSLRSILTYCSLNADTVFAAMSTPEIKLRLRNTTQQAIEAGIFGVPTFRMRGELFWGADRVDAVIWALRGGTIDQALYDDVLGRPAAAAR
jgi:2-hydroxychromene-2-carboxylate isomerase